MQGSPLLTTAITLPGVECVAACDLYDGHRELAKEIVGNTGLATTRRYQELLDNKDIDCLIVAVPDHWHKQVVVDAVSAGKDVYCEKPMSHTAAEGFDMADAQKKTGRIVQIGSQRVSSVIYGKAKEMIAQGAIGNLNLVEGTLGRNDPTGCWEYTPPTDLVPAESRLGHLARHRPQARFRSPALRSLALLEGIRHGRGWRPAGPPGQRNDLCG